MDRVALDTSFLIDLQNEHRGRGRPCGAIAFLHANRRTEVLLPAVALGEYLEGFDDPQSDEALALVGPLRVLDVNSEVARDYAAVTRSLRSSGRLIIRAFDACRPLTIVRLIARSCVRFVCARVE